MIHVCGLVADARVRRETGDPEHEPTHVHGVGRDLAARLPSLEQQREQRADEQELRPRVGAVIRTRGIAGVIQHRHEDGRCDRADDAEGDEIPARPAPSFKHAITISGQRK